MLRQALRLLALCLLSGPVVAHEFWIEPQSMTLATGDELRPVVKIGTDFEGEPHPFDPRAYRRIIWTASDADAAGNGATRAQRFTQRAPGMHILGVESNPQVLSHDTVTEFTAYIAEIGLSGRVETADPGLVAGGPIIERYQRFSKTLVRFSDRSGSDRPIGLRYEWVRQADAFQLLADGAPGAHHPVFLFCRDGEGAVAERQSYETDAQGRIALAGERGQTCLLNATFISRQQDRSWLSAWTSILFES